MRKAPKGSAKAAVMPAAALRRVRGSSAAVGFVVEMVTVLVAGAPEVTLRLAGEKVQVEAWGKPVQVSATAPLKLLVGTALMTAVAEEPSLTVSVELEALKPNVAVPLVVELVLIAPSRPCFSWASPAVK